MNSGGTERDNEYDKRAVFGGTPGACASGSNGARDNGGASGFPAGRNR
jgi:hypothetical protein